MGSDAGRAGRGVTTTTRPRGCGPQAHTHTQLLRCLPRLPHRAGRGPPASPVTPGAPSSSTNTPNAARRLTVPRTTCPSSSDARLGASLRLRSDRSTLRQGAEGKRGRPVSERGREPGAWLARGAGRQRRRTAAALPSRRQRPLTCRPPPSALGRSPGCPLGTPPPAAPQSRRTAGSACRGGGARGGDGGARAQCPAQEALPAPATDRPPASQHSTQEPAALAHRTRASRFRARHTNTPAAPADRT